MTDLVTVDQAAQFLRLVNPTTEDTAILTLIVGWASARITKELSAVDAVTVTEAVQPTGRSFILQRTPVTAVTSMTPVLDSSPAVDVDGLSIVNALGGVVRVVSGSTPFGLYTVVYTASRVSTPVGVDGACLTLIRHWWNQSQAHASSTYGDSGFVPDFRDLPNAVRNMLAVESPVSGVA